MLVLHFVPSHPRLGATAVSYSPPIQGEGCLSPHPEGRPPLLLLQLTQQRGRGPASP